VMRAKIILTEILVLLLAFAALYGFWIGTP